MELFAVFAIVIAMVIFAYQVKVPIYYMFSSVIAMAGSLFLFNLHGSGGSGTQHESPAYVMFAIIFIAVALWQLGEAIREFNR